MALIFNPFMKTFTFTDAIGRATSSPLRDGGGTTYLHIYPSTVPFPSSGVPSSIANTWIARFNISNTNFYDYSVDTSSSLYAYVGYATATAVGTGTASWWLHTLTISSTTYAICSDSLGINGSNNIITLSDTNIANNSTVILTSYIIRTV